MYRPTTQVGGVGRSFHKMLCHFLGLLFNKLELKEANFERTIRGQTLAELLAEAAGGKISSKTIWV